MTVDAAVMVAIGTVATAVAFTYLAALAVFEWVQAAGARVVAFYLLRGEL